MSGHVGVAGDGRATVGVRPARAVAVAAVALLALVALGGGAALGAEAPPAKCPNAAGYYPPGQCKKLLVSRTRVVPGGSLQVSASGYAPGSAVSIELPERRLARGTADGQGRLALGLEVPADTASGDYELTSVGTDEAGHPLVLAAAVSVAEDGATGGSAPPLVVGGAALAGGVLVALVARRRIRRRSSPS